MQTSQHKGSQGVDIGSGEPRPRATDGPPAVPLRVVMLVATSCINDGRVIKEAGDDKATQIDRAWRIALGRAPTAEESASALRLLHVLEREKDEPPGDLPKTLQVVPPGHAHALSKLCLALFNLSEFVFVD